MMALCNTVWKKCNQVQLCHLSLGPKNDASSPQFIGTLTSHSEPCEAM